MIDARIGSYTAPRRKLGVLLRRQQSRCARCSSQVVTHRAVRLYRPGFKKSRSHISWRTPAGNAMTRLIATVDHSLSRHDRLQLADSANEIDSLTCLCTFCHRAKAPLKSAG